MLGIDNTLPYVWPIHILACDWLVDDNDEELLQLATISEQCFRCTFAVTLESKFYEELTKVIAGGVVGATP